MRFKITFVWWPRRIVLKDGEVFRFIGWVWLQRAYLTNNLNHGWIAFADNQTVAKLCVCPACGRPSTERSE